MKKIVLLGAGIAALGTLGGGATGAAAAEVKLKAASFLPGRATVAKPFVRWVGEVNKRCAGKVNISVVGPAAIGSLQQWNALKTGVVDMHYGPANYFRGTMPEAAVTDLAQNSLVQQRKNGVMKILNEIFAKKMNARMLTYLTNGLRFYLFTRKAGKDGRFDGMRLRSVPIYDAFFRSLGATPIRMAPPAVFTGLERGTVDGYGWPNWGVADFGWQKYTKFQYGPGFLNAGVQVLINLDKWKSLEEDQRKCLHDMALWFESEWPKWREQTEKEQQAILTKAGVKYVDLGPEFPKKAADLYWAAIAKANPEFAKKMRPLLSK